MYAAAVCLDSSIKRAVRGFPKLKTTSTFPICNLFHLWCDSTLGGLEIETCITVSVSPPSEDTGMRIFSSNSLVF
jgi:hypothetical protein